MDIFTNLDPVVKILSLGISGLCFLLVIMAYKLISNEQKKENPRTSILRAIYIFMTLNLLNVIVVGFLGLPAISQNLKLKEENLSKENELNLIQKVNEFDLIIDKANTSSIDKKLVNTAQDYLQSLDSLAGSYSTVDSQKADSINDFKTIITQQVNTLNADTSSAVTKENALKQINLANHKLTRMVRTKRKIN